MIFILNKQEKVINTLKNSVGAGNKPSFYNDVLTEDLGSGSETFTFSTVGVGSVTRDIVIGNYVAFRKGDKYKLFQIMQVEESHEDTIYLDVYCESAGLELINTVFRRRKMISTTIERFMQTVLQDTTWNVGMIEAGFTESVDLELEDASVYATLQNNISTFRGELEFRVEINNGRIAARYVDVYKFRGKVTGKRFVFGTNIEKISRKVDSTDLFTALIGVGKDGLNFSDITLDGIDKPMGQDYVADTKAFDRYGKNGYHLMGLYSFETESKEELLRETYKKLQDHTEPKIEYTVEVALLESILGTVNIGDTVSVIDNAFNPPIHLMARVNKLETSMTDPQSNKCTLANFIEVKSNITEEMRKIASELQGYVDSNISDRFPISGDDIMDGAIDSKHIYESSITTDHLKAGSVVAEKISANEIQSQHIKSESIQTQHLQANSVTAEKLDSNSVGTNHLQAGSIDAGKIQVGTITAESGILADASITSATIGNAVVDSIHIKAGAIDSVAIGDAVIDSAHIKDAAINSTHIKEAAIDTMHVKDASIDNAKIKELSADKITSGTISADRIAAGSITADKVVVGDSSEMSTVTENNANTMIDVFGGTKIEVVDGAREVRKKEVANPHFMFSNHTPMKFKGGEEVEFEIDLYSHNTIDKIGKIGVWCYNDNKTWITENTVEIDLKGQVWKTYKGSIKLNEKFKEAYYYVVGLTNVHNFQVSARKISFKKKSSGELIVNGTITADKLAANSITTDKLQAGVVTTDKLQANSVDANKIKANSIQTQHLQANVISSDKLQANSVQAKHIQAGVITADKIQSGTITADSGILANASIGSAQIQEASIGSVHIKKGAVDSLAIGQAAIQTAHIGQAQIQTGNIKDASITSAKISQGAIGNAHITDATISGAKISNATITNTQIANATITDANIKSLNANKITAGTIDTAKIQVSSTSGKLNISNNTMQIKDANNRVRVQLGQDATGDYGLIVSNAQGQVMWDFSGVNGNGIQNNAVGTDKIKNESITSNKLVMDEIFANEGWIGNLQAVDLRAEQISTGKINSERLDISGLVAFENMNQDMKENFVFDTSSNKTFINGGAIYANSVTADKINAKGLNVTDANNSPTFIIDKQGEVFISGNVQSSNFSDVQGIEQGYKISKDGDIVINDAVIRGDVRLGNAGITNFAGSNGNPNIFKNSSFMKYAVTNNIGWDNNLNGSFTVTNWGLYNSGLTNANTGYHAHLDIKKFGMPVIKYVNETDRWLGASQGIPKGVMQAGQTYTFSVDVYAENLAVKPYGGFYYTKKGETSAGFHSGQYTFTINKTNSWIRCSWTFKVDNNIDPEKTSSFYMYGHNGRGTFYIKNPKLEKGPDNTPWTPHEEDQINATRFWAGTDFLNRDKAPFRVLQDGSVIATKGDFGGTITGQINIGNIHIADTSQSEGLFQMKDNTDTNVLIQLSGEGESWIKNNFYLGASKNVLFDGKTGLLTLNKGIAINGTSTKVSTDSVGRLFIEDNPSGGRHVFNYSTSENYAGALVIDSLGSQGKLGGDFMFRRKYGDEDAIFRVLGELNVSKKISSNNSKIEMVARSDGFDFMVK